MSYREIPEDKILKFSATPGFKGWKHFFTEESVSHPAKMNLNLLRHILKTYTDQGDVVLDPMAGTGSTIVLASMMGRNGVAVEFEPKFCDMIQDNIARAEKQAALTAKGRMKCYQGDARELSKLLGESDAIITSPPYSSQWGSADENRPKATYEREQRHKKRHPEYPRPPLPGFYSTDMNNIGNLPHGDIDMVLTSPPYGNRLSDVAIQDADPARMGYRQTVDVVLTSPPYEATDLDARDVEKRAERLEKAGYDSKKYLGGRARNTTLKPYNEVDAIVSSPPYGSDNANLQGREDKSAKSILGSTGVRSVDLDPENLGTLEYGDIDAVVTSPPYQDSLIGGGQREKEGFNQGHTRGKPCFKNGYSKDSDNIGTLKSDNYLEAMLQVYREAHKVLKPEGKMVLVTKNFIRDKQVIRLDIDTIKLCESVGFKLIDHLYFELPTKSFWKIIYERKYPNAPVVKYEDVLVFEKSAVLVPPTGRNQDE